MHVRARERKNLPEEFCLDEILECQRDWCFLGDVANEHSHDHNRVPPAPLLIIAQRFGAHPMGWASSAAGSSEVRRFLVAIVNSNPHKTGIRQPASICVSLTEVT